MQRFFFHSDFDECIADEQGTMCADVGEARGAAVRLLAELLRDHGDAFEVKPLASVAVTDTNGVFLWKIEAAAKANF